MRCARECVGAYISGEVGWYRRFVYNACPNSNVETGVFCMIFEGVESDESTETGAAMASLHPDFPSARKHLLSSMKEVIQMKKYMRVLAFVLCGALLALGLVGCGSQKKETLKIGIIQYMSHPSLDNCYEGVVQALEASGLDYTVERQIGSSSSAEADCSTFAQNMVGKGCDLIVAIATPAATAAYAAVEGTDIPLIFCAVSDPVVADLVKDMNAPGGNCTGTSDVLDLAAQVELIKAMQPTAKSIGILYTTSEQNSLSNLKRMQELCDKQGIAIEATGVQNASDIPAAAAALAGKVDCINNFTDNNVVENLNVVLDAANAAKIPVYGSEVEQVSNGCLASMSIDYVALGKTTGNMAVRVLKGETKPAEMAVESITEATPVINTDVVAALGLTIPEPYANAEKVTTKQ